MNKMIYKVNTRLLLVNCLVLLVMAPAILEAAKWKVYENATLIENKYNDGDSFHVQCAKGDVEFRIYYVDTPESAAKTYRNGENNFKRL